MTLIRTIRYVRTDNNACFVVDYSANAPRPSTSVAMGECTNGSLIMNEIINTQTCCFDHCFAFPVDGIVRPEPALGYDNHLARLAVGLASCTALCQDGDVSVPIYAAPHHFTQNACYRSVCLLWVDWKSLILKRQWQGICDVSTWATAVFLGCATDCRYCHNLPSGPLHGFVQVVGTTMYATCGFEDCAVAPNVKIGTNCYNTASDLGANKIVTYLRVYRDEGVCGSVYNYPAGHCSICLNLPVALSFVASTG